MRLCEKEACTGCGACFNICPVHAIQMIEDREGFARPVVNEKMCIRCEKCTHACPILSPVSLPRDPAPTPFAAWNRDPVVRKSSSSGGMATLFGESILAQGGTVFGAAFDAHFVVRHRAAYSPAELALFRGSKYVQSDMGETPRAVKQELQNGRPVLFIGAPCQVAGLYGFLGGDHERLLTCDFICFGVPSPRVFREYVRFMTNRYGSPIETIAFRNKEWGWQRFSIWIRFQNGREYRRLFGGGEDPYAWGFCHALFLRPSCYACPYASLPRLGDITLADFWGIARKEPFPYDTFNGLSLILVNSPKGRATWDSLKDRYVAVERTLEEAFAGNYRLRQGTPRPADREAFFDVLNERGFEEAVRRHLVPRGPPRWIRIKRSLKRLLLHLPIKRLRPQFAP